MTLTILALLLCAGVIYASCEYFVNGIEWIGLRIGIARSAVGTVLAAFGTALPESVVTFVAVVNGGSPAEQGVGVGAALGGPLVLATVAYGVVGLGSLAYRRRNDASWVAPSVQARLAADQSWFLAVFIVKFGAGLMAFAYKPALGILFLVAYVVYTWREISSGEAHDEPAELEPLKIRPRDPAPPLGWAVLQTTIALTVTYLGSRFFVRELVVLAPAVGIPAQLVALLLSPVATELPETLNALIWLRQGKLSLALGNISGSMIIQATVPSALGILFTPWLFDRALIIAAAVTTVAIMLMIVQLRRATLTPARLAAFILLYGVFVGLLLSPWWRPGS